MEDTRQKEFEAVGRLDSATWWKEFIDYFVSKGVDRTSLTQAVNKFRSAQGLVADAIADADYFIPDRD